MMSELSKLSIEKKKFKHFIVRENSKAVRLFYCTNYNFFYSFIKEQRGVV
jgi:hypothetical protein